MPRFESKGESHVQLRNGTRSTAISPGDPKSPSTVARWNVAAAEYGLPVLKDQGEPTARWLSEVLDKIENAKTTILQHAPRIKRELPERFPRGLDVELLLTSP